MRKIIAALILLFIKVAAQEFAVDKVSGVVMAMKGTEENWVQIKAGQKLSIHDLISTSEKSFVQLSNKDSKFILKNNSAVNLSAVKKMTLNELLLALAAEDIRNIHIKRNNENLKNTAVYGKDESSVKKMYPAAKDLGNKRINGAKQLIENGYKESALLVAKETFRKYPETKNNMEARLYFIDLMLTLNMKNEAASELTDLRVTNKNSSYLGAIDARLIKIKNESVGK